MHQWSTSTHKSVSDPVKDKGIFQFQLPRWTLKHEFLFCGIMSLSALEISLSEEGREGRNSAIYARVGIEYYDKAVSASREQLPKLPPEHAHLTFIFSSLLNIINMAIPQCMPLVSGNPMESVKEHMGQFMNLIRGSSGLFLANRENIQFGPVWAPVNETIFSAFESLSSRMNEDYEGVFSRLASIVHYNYPEKIEPTQETAILDLPVYSRAVKMLRLCFAEEAKPGNKGFCIAFPSLTGPVFISAFQNSEPLALYIALHWAVLLHGMDTEYWWAKGIGQNQGEELSQMLRVGVKPAVNQLWQEGMAWAMKQIGLPILDDLPFEAFLEGWEDG